MDSRLIEAREVPLGGLRALNVWRTLPHRELPTVGAWCFVDHFGPTADSMDVLPHPHIGLQTVTWPIAGDIRHRDSLGNDVVLKPGELNLMTAGYGVSHSEFSVAGPDQMHGVQLWLALPDGSRDRTPAFEHVADLPQMSGPGWSGIILVGEFDGVRSPATTYTPLIGMELTLHGAADLVVNSDFEHAILAINGPVTVDGHAVAHRQMFHVDRGRERIGLAAEPGRTVMLLGGEPFTDPLVMWWNFIGRDHDEIVHAREDWEANAARFGRVEGHGDQRIPAPPMPALRLKPRVRRT